MNLAETLINRVRLNGECWEYTRTSKGNAYGRLSLNKIRERTHRLSYLTFVGPIPDGLWVLHRCDNPPCINPAHLFLGTQLENMRDAKTKGRLKLPPKPKPEDYARGDRSGMRLYPGLSRGEKNGNSKLTDTERAEILELRRTTKLSALKIGAMFGVSESAVLRIPESFRHTRTTRPSESDSGRDSALTRTLLEDDKTQRGFEVSETTTEASKALREWSGQ